MNLEALLITAAIIYFVGWCGINATLAYEKGKSVGGMILFSAVCSPLIAYLYLLATPKEYESENQHGSRGIANNPNVHP